MAKTNTERANPLLAAGIKTKQEREIEMRSAAPVQPHQEAQEELDGKERATEKVTAYFTPSQFDRIDELQRAHRKRTGKRITVNALLRRLVENATVEDTLA